MTQRSAAPIATIAQARMIRSAFLIFPGCMALKPISALQAVVLAEPIRRQPVEVLANRRGIRASLNSVRTSSRRQDIPALGDDLDPPSLVPIHDRDVVLRGGRRVVDLLGHLSPCEPRSG